MQRRALVSLSIAFLSLSAARLVKAQDTTPFKPEELDAMLAPIALYPDALLSQVLMAATYPLEVVEAARWSKTNPNLKGDDAVNAVKGKDWDVSVMSLVAFPSVLQQMNDHLDWTQKLGDAMIGQQQDVADSIQRLRADAAKAGNLQNTPQETITTTGSGDSVQYVIMPTNPDVIYVPAYDPAWVYGTWAYPAYPPVYYPLAGALIRGFFWGLGFAAAGALFGGWNWGGRGHSYVNVNVNRAVNINNHFDRNKFAGDGGKWQHDPDHRRGVPYRDAAARQQFGQTRPGVQQRQQFRGQTGQGNPPRPGGPQPGARPAQAASVQRPAPQSHGNVQPPRGGGALGGVNRGQQVNREAARGRTVQTRAASHPAPAPARGGGGGAKPGERR
jgi:hypothetical protein